MAGEWTGPVETVKENLKHGEAVLTQVGEQVILPMLEARYDATGLQKRTGMMKTAVSKRGAPGNVFEVSDSKLTVGIDYNAVPWAKYQLEGSLAHEIRPRKPGGLLVFFWKKLGKVVYLRRVSHPGTKARLIYVLEPGALARANEVVSEAMGVDWSVRQVK